MARLSYDRYVTQGGDWGSAVTHAMGLSETEHCIALHTNMPLLSPSEAVTKDLTEQEESALAGFQRYWDWDSGYSKEQSTRPQTVGYGLVDSPVAQCPWILEKFWSWTDCNGHPENALTRDEILDNIHAVLAAGRGRFLGSHLLGELPTAGTQVALETGTVAFVARQLGRLGLDSIVVDAHEVRLKAHRPNQKSDGRDALELCEGLRRGIYRSIVHVPRPEISRLRDTLSRRRHFVQLQAAQVGAVKALLRAGGLVHLSRSLGSRAQDRAGDPGYVSGPRAHRSCMGPRSQD